MQIPTRESIKMENQMRDDLGRGDKKLKALSTFLSILFILVSSTCRSQDLKETATLAIFDAHLFDGQEFQGKAIAIRDNRILAVGTNGEIEDLCDAKTIRIDAKGATVTPGLIDSHVHFLSGSLSLDQVDLLEAQSIEAVEKTIRDYVDRNPSKKFILGRGWYYGVFSGGMPTKEILDGLIPDKPALMRCYDGHTTWVNSQAMQLAKVDRNTPNPNGGEIVKDPKTGEPTGVFLEAAQNLFDAVTPEATRQEKLEAMKLGIELAHQFGVTSVHEAGVGERELQLFQTLIDAKEFPLRMHVALEVQAGMTEDDADRFEGMRKRYTDQNISAVKIYSDGVIESHTASLISPYANSVSRGRLEYSVEEMNRLISMFDRRGWQWMIHATGDGGIRTAIDALELAQMENPKPARGRRHRIEHIESISAEDIPRFGELGLIASMQPYHANPNQNLFQVWAANLGPERASRAWCWNRLRKGGAVLAFGSDWPVVSLEPRIGIHTALTRQTLDGEPPSGFIPEECLPLEQVLEAYTSGAAFAEFEELQKGKLAPGFLADMVVWNQDLAKLAPAKVKDTSVRLTIFNGKIVYDVDAP